MIKYIVLDVDRTIVDSFEPELLSFQEAIEKVIGYKLPIEQIEEFSKLPTNTVFEKLHLNNEQIKQMEREWSSAFEKYKINCFKGIKEVLKELSNKGFIIGIITSRTIEEFHELDEELNDIMNIFTVIVTSDIIKKPKPNSDSMIYLCNQLGCHEKDVIYIGDSIVDKEFANNSGCHFIPVCYDNKELKNEKNACFDPKELPKIIEEIIEE